MDVRKQLTVDNYNKSAKSRAADFQVLGARTDAIDLAIKLAGNPENPKVVEIGCGDGRDAAEIIKHTPNYTGFDISEELIKLARENVPEAHFEVSDAVGYEYPSDLDIVFAFASLIHLSRDEMIETFKNLYTALKTGGVIFLSLKLADHYKEEMFKDNHGERQFFFYNPELIKELAGDGFEVVHTKKGFVTAGYIQWFDIALRKTNKS